MARREVAHGEVKDLVAWSAIPGGFPHQFYKGISWECHLCGGHFYSKHEIKRHLEEEHEVQNIGFDDLNRVYGEAPEKQ
jgi:hypothetical protein